MLDILAAKLAVVLIAGAPSPPPPPAPTGDLVARAQTQYAKGRYAAAAVDYHRVASGRIAGDRGAAEFGLARSLHKMGYRSAARSAFLGISDPATAHPYRKRALPWLAALARELEGDAALYTAIATYSEADLADGRFDTVRDELHFSLGRALYESGELERAVSILGQVPADSEFFVPAQFFVGVAETRLWQGQKAVDAFKNVLRTQKRLRAGFNERQLRRIDRFTRRRARLQDKRRRKGLLRLRRRMARRGLDDRDLDRVRETRRYDQMASLSMGYVFYQSGQLDLALKYFGRLPQESPYWLDGVFGAAWTEFLLAVEEPERANLHYQKTLGHIHTLGAPFFPYRLYPEAPLLKAMTYYYNCRYGTALLAIKEFNRRYGDARVQLKRLLERYPEDFELLRIYEELEAGSSGLEEADRRILEGLLDDDELRRKYALVRKLHAEAQVLDNAPPVLRGTELAELIAEDIDLAVSMSREETGAAVRQRLASAVAQIGKFEKNAIRIQYEIAPKALEGLGERKKPQRPPVGPQHEGYSYNGEYWQDELANYHYRVTSLCKE